MCQDKYNVEIDVSNDRASYINDVDDDDLEDFQRPEKSLNFLKDPYDKFYRKVAKPFCKIHVRDFMNALKDVHTYYSSIWSYNEKILVE